MVHHVLSVASSSSTIVRSLVRLLALLSAHLSLIHCIFAKMELIEVVFAATRYYSIASDVTRKSNGVCTITAGV